MTDPGVIIVVNFFCFTKPKPAVLLLVFVSLALLVSACTQAVDSPQSASSWTKSFRFQAVSDESVLYLPPLENCRLVHAFEIKRGDPGEVRLYSVNQGILPDGLTAIPLHNTANKHKQANPVEIGRAHV